MRAAFGWSPGSSATCHDRPTRPERRACRVMPAAAETIERGPSAPITTRQATRHRRTGWTVRAVHEHVGGLAVVGELHLPHGGTGPDVDARGAGRRDEGRIQ